MQRKYISIYILITLFLSALLLCLFIFTVNRGVGVTADSVSYFWGAESLLSGNGYRYPNASLELIPITRWPPGYSIFLAIATRVVGSPEMGVYILNATLLLGSFMMFVMFLLYAFGNSPWVTIWAMCVYIASPSVLPVYGMVWSEPLYIFFSFIAIHSLLLYSRSHDRRYVYIAAVASVVCEMTKFIGISVMITGLIYLWSETRFRRADRFSIFRFLLITTSPLIWWKIRDVRVSSEFFGHIVSWHPPSLTRLSDAAAVVGQWASSNMPTVPSEPNYSNAPLGMFVLILLIILSVAYGKHIQKRVPKTIFVATLYILSYCMAYFVAVSFIDANAEIDFRTFAPVYPFVLFLFVCITHTVVRVQKKKPVEISGIICSVYFLVVSTTQMVGWVRTAMTTGLGANRWKDKLVVSLVNDQFSKKIIYTNRSKPAFFLFHRPAFGLPVKRDRMSELINTQYDHEYKIMEESFKQHKAVLVFFPLGYNEEVYLPSESYLISQLGLYMVRNDGEIRLYAKR